MGEHAFKKKNNVVLMQKADGPDYTRKPSPVRKQVVRQKKNPLAIRVVLAVLCLSVLYMGWNYFQLMGEVKHQKAELGVLKKRVAESKLENERLQHQKQILNSDAFIEKIAREELGMIKEGEILIKVDDNKDKQ